MARFRIERVALAASVALGAMGMVNFGGRLEGSVPHAVQFAAVALAAALQYALYSLVLRVAPRLTGRPAVITAAVGALMLLTVLAVYPAVDSRPNAGNDNDDALTIGVEAILDGDDPYALRTYHGLPVAPLPGGFVLAAPAVIATGRSGATTILSLIAFAVTIHYAGNRDAPDAPRLALLLAATPTVWLSLANGSDELAVGLWAITAAGLLLRPGGGAVISAVGAAIAVCTRTFVAPVLLPLLVLLWRAPARRHARAKMAVFVATSMALFVPFADRLLHGTFPPMQVVTENKRDAIQLSSPVYYGLIAMGLFTTLRVTWIVLRAVSERALASLLDLWARAAWLIIAVPFAGVVLLSPTHLQSASYFNAIVPFALAALVFRERREAAPT